MSEKKVSLRDLRELLRRHPKPRIIGEHAVFDYSLAEEYQKWIEEFTEAFNQFEKQLYESKKVMKKLITETLASFKARDEFVPVSKILEECINVCYRKEILGEKEVERK